MYDISQKATYEREKLSKEIMESWLKEKPKYAVIHWDKKIIDFVTGKKEERVTIIVSGAISGYDKFLVFSTFINFS
jgi:hypothetical protein